MRTIKFWLINLALLPVAALAQPDTTGRSVNTPGEALEVAYAYTGFEEIQALINEEDYNNVQAITCKDSTIPWLVNQVYNKPVWEIYLDDVYFDWPNFNSGFKAKYNPKQFYVLIDSTHGLFIKAFTKWNGEHDPDLGSEPSAESAERQMRGDGVFHSFCTMSPPVSMYQTLGAAPGSYPLSSKELSILLVRQMYGAEEKSLWHIFSRGFPPEPFRTGAGSFNHAHSVVDAESGRWLYRSASPHPGPTKSQGE